MVWPCHHLYAKKSLPTAIAGIQHIIWRVLVTDRQRHLPLREPRYGAAAALKRDKALTLSCQMTSLLLLAKPRPGRLQGSNRQIGYGGPE